jgi:excisionase family DNA binding protein
MHKVRTQPNSPAPIHPITGTPADGYFDAGHVWIWSWSHVTERGARPTRAALASAGVARRRILRDNVLTYTPAEAAAALRVSLKTIHRMLQRGQLVASKVGSGRGCWRVPLESIKALLPKGEIQ